MRLKMMQASCRTGLWLCCFFIYCGLSLTLFSQTPVPSAGPAEASPSGQVQVTKPQEENSPPASDLVIDTERKEIRLNCKLAITEGILEFFLVDEKGRTYESVFKLTNCEPSDLHFALLLLGLETVSFKDYAGQLKNPAAVEVLKKKKCLLKLEIRHQGKQVPLASLLKNRETGSVRELYWVFTGAPFNAENNYLADYSDVYISIWQEPFAVLNLLFDAGNPYRGELGFEMAENHGFNVDDEFTLILKGVS